jgi:nucleoside-diphosphate-sugar epimerase
MKILITGATGFIGSHICKELINKNHTVYAICRNSSNFDKCSSFTDKIIWVNQDKNNDLNELIKIPNIDVLIHAAWSGINPKDRNNWDIQLENFRYSKSIIELAIQLNIKKIICLGSQSEYGIYNYKVTENHIPSPIDAYGCIKLLTLHYLQNVAAKYHLTWYWLRIFSILGENDNQNWLLPQVIKRLINNEEIKLTKGEQYYDYLYIDDFIKCLDKIVNDKLNKSGIYNVCSGRPVKIKQLLLVVAQQLGKTPQFLKFGAIPYRENQNMFMVGSPDKCQSTFGKCEFEPIEDSIKKIIYFYKTT